MKPLKTFAARSAVAALAIMIQGSPAHAEAGSPGTAGRPLKRAAQHSAGIAMRQGGSFALAEIEGGRFELTYSGKRFVARAPVERYLLYRAALLAKQRRSSWFGLLYLPGEQGPTVHPSDSSIGRYGHWQPHWNYEVTGLGWQPWHPEWGAAFWSEGVDLSRVEAYQAHAMIELHNEKPAGMDQPVFETASVLRDLGSEFR